MKKLTINLITALLLVGLVGCQGYFDINENPNRSTAADPAFLLTFAQTDYATNRSIDFGVSAIAFSQIQAPGTFGVFVNPARYTISTFTNGNTWNSVYSNQLVNLNEAIKISEAQSPADFNASAQCKIFSALCYYTATMIWEDVPFSEALQPADFPQPNFDSQKDVLESVIALLDEAIAQIDVTSALGIGSNDLIYGGDMSKWVRFANSLKFRALMVMVDADPSKEDMILAMLSNAEMIGSQDDMAFFPFQNQSGNYNPIWRILDTYTGRDNICYFGSEATINLMKRLGDPRLDIYFTAGPAQDTLQPVGPGEAGSIANSARMSWSDGGSSAIIRPDQPELLYTYSEQKLLEAEAQLRFNEDAATADQLMREGVAASAAYYGVAQDDIDAYLATIPDLATLSTENAWKAIAEQQWIDFIERPLEAWTSWRRTEIPALELPFNAPTTDIIRRFRYPTNEANANTNTPNQKQLDEKMWFDL